MRSSYAKVIPAWRLTVHAALFGRSNASRVDSRSALAYYAQKGVVMDCWPKRLKGTGVRAGETQMMVQECNSSDGSAKREKHATAEGGIYMGTHVSKGAGLVQMMCVCSSSSLTSEGKIEISRQEAHKALRRNGRRGLRKLGAG